MSSRYDDVHHLRDKSSAGFHPNRGKMSRGLCQPERRSKAKRLQYNEIQPPSSSGINLRISSSCTFIRNKGLPNNVISGNLSKPSYPLCLQGHLVNNRKRHHEKEDYTGRREAKERRLQCKSKSESDWRGSTCGKVN
ncbi:unnamed protein product [Protopolystoma xenopodis]|uniref:Uncharacterized protein n=1 Tax=Protopolystoma xenopodis TaxID=117903 RepID=A0A3S5ART7_9PLAT|nr:unnamed protein product [Protopolystoma xenopodis]